MAKKTDKNKISENINPQRPFDALAQFIYDIKLFAARLPFKKKHLLGMMVLALIASAGLGIARAGLAKNSGGLALSVAKSQAAAAPEFSPDDLAAGKGAVLGANTSARGEDFSVTPAPTETIMFNDTSVTAESFLVFDPVSKSVLISKNTDERLSIGSLTKLLTGLVAYESPAFDLAATVTANDILRVAPGIDLKPGEQIKISDLFNSMIIGSANDAALAVSHAVGGTNFVAQMNSKARVLGMNSSHFSNPMGFDSVENYSTATDLLKLVLATQQYSAFTGLGRRTEYRFTDLGGEVHYVAATNKLIASHPEIEAVKTGYTPNAAGAMIAKFTENGHAIIVIVLNSQNREADTLNLGEAVFKDFSWR